MKTPIAIALGVLLLAGAGTAAEKPKPTPAPKATPKATPKTEKDKVNYTIGYRFGAEFKRQGIDLDPDLVAKGFRDAVEGKEPLMNPKDMASTWADLRKKTIAAQRKEQKELAAKQLAEGEAFLAENGKKQGVVTLPSGLQYQVIKEGTGKSPAATDNVTVHYRGTLIDGREFDSSLKRGKPATFPLDRMIPGWTQALPLMREGAKWKLFLPAKLGYGERGAGPAIPPNAVLIFELELISVQPAGQPPRKGAGSGVTSS